MAATRNYEHVDANRITFNGFIDPRSFSGDLRMKLILAKQGQHVNLATSLLLFFIFLIDSVQ